MEAYEHASWKKVLNSGWECHKVEVQVGINSWSIRSLSRLKTGNKLRNQKDYLKT